MVFWWLLHRDGKSQYRRAALAATKCVTRCIRNTWIPCTTTTVAASVRPVPDCHVPHEFVPKMIRKLKASKELYGKIFGVIDTPQKFEAHRLTMAQNEWRRMKDNNSQECRNCHNFEYMDTTAQKSVAAKMHDQAVKDGQTCIDCHKGIAHKLPDMREVEPGF
ncbi:NapC/NirT family cytochrome c [Escherichia coli]